MGSDGDVKHTPSGTKDFQDPESPVGIMDLDTSNFLQLHLLPCHPWFDLLDKPLDCPIIQLKYDPATDPDNPTYGENLATDSLGPSHGEIPPSFLQLVHKHGKWKEPILSLTELLHGYKGPPPPKSTVCPQVTREFIPADILTKHLNSQQIWKLLLALLFWPGDTTNHLNC
jgi:hypothetical protein